MDSLRGIQSEAERMTELTDSMLVLARSDAGNLQMPKAPMDISELVSSVVQGNQPLAESRGISLRAAANGGQKPVMGNEAGLRQLLLILIENALRYTPPGGRVTVSAASAPGATMLSVEDTGEGISSEALPHVFERFYQADPARQSGAGAGLGLSIAQAIAQAHGSSLSVESESGVGTRFTLELQD
jgi:signal transduction histidine kinase